MRRLFLEILLLTLVSCIAFAQQVAPGVELPKHGDVWVLDGATPDHLVRLKYSAVHTNLHRGANFGRSMAWPVGGRIQTTIEISGAAAAARLSNSAPVFYLRSIFADPEEAAEITAPGAMPAILCLHPEKNARVLEAIAYTQITGTAHPQDQPVKLTIKRIPDTDWLEATPAQPLPPGEYALTWISAKPNDGSFPEIVYDFGVGSGPARMQARH